MSNYAKQVTKNNLAKGRIAVLFLFAAANALVCRVRWADTQTQTALIGSADFAQLIRVPNALRQTDRQTHTPYATLRATSVTIGRIHALRGGNTA